MRGCFVSIVVPTHNERDNIAPLYGRIRHTFDALTGFDFELIFVDDSTDDTPGVIRQVHATDQRVKLVRLSRRFSQSIAITAGLKRASGDAVILMDADLQDPPEVIPKMIGLWQHGYDVVYAQRSSNSSYRLYRTVAGIFYRLLRVISSIDIPRNAGEFRLLDGSVLRFMNSLTEHTRFFRGLTLWPAGKSIAIPIDRAQRAAGKTNYNFWRSLLVAVDGFTSFSIVPLRLAAVIGCVLSFCSLSLGAGYLVVRALYPPPFGSGWPSLFISIWFLGGVQLLFIGIVGEYLGRIYIEVQNRPLYWVTEELGFCNTDNKHAKIAHP